jgi:ABC-type transporter Mla MlaB component
MPFRIDSQQHKNRVRLHVAGELSGRQAERVLREQIVRAVADRGHVVLDVAEVTVIDPGCLAVIEAGLGDWLSVEGGGPYLRTLLSRGRT